MILPKPQQFERLDGAFHLTSSATVRADEASAQAARALRRALAPATGFALDDASADAPAAVTLRVDDSLVGPEAYRLTVTTEGVEIAGSDPSGVFYGVQSLRQLLPAEIFSATKVERQWEIPAVAVVDRPRFGWRGTMLDVARHFMPKEFVLKLIDLLALHKLNVFHFHLTEDQGWRLASEKYPRLTEVGAYRPETLVGHAHRPESEFTFDGKPHGGYYTQDDIREIVAYAQERFVTVVPEIDMPGHMLAAIAAYPELGNGLKPAKVWTRWGISEQVLNVEDSTLDFCRDILDEVMSLFPSPLIHCGGDECPKAEWKVSPAAQERMRSLGLADENALQAWFTAQMAAHLADRGRRFVGWDEVLEGGGPANLPEDVVVMSWRSEEGGIEAARGGLDVVMAPCQTVYFDYYQSEDKDAEPLAIGGFVPLEKVYDYRPIPGELDAEASRHVLGAQCQLWTEYVPTPEHAEYMLFPRVCAFAEAVWRDETGGVEEYTTFLDRLRPHLARLDTLGVNYRRLD
ncbi:beta-N-acetylhexosaminidase [Actinopolymorpha singaporensis]|uniref:beta-N-acetylhexosaminidase n=1 Tax=Actinopolymorpha singaporensis TaxID=117157 RepID=A0A1H1LJ68_9ACTN|nr:beta-N-acetylhexosaminidase [Actinopolymorpha singaporensis]SDR74075.1 hexosaminidase [Actinopolymorpha singaporensis]